MKQSKKVTQSKFSSYVVKILFGLAFILTAYIAFYQLGKAPLENWDEAWYADATRHMMQTKEFFVLYWNNAIWLDKPPMYMWFSALISSVIGLSEFSVRLTSAISGIIIVMLVTRYAYKNYGLVPAFLAFVTLALNNVFIWRMRSGNLDILATLFILLVFLVTVSKIKYKYPLLGLLFACIYLTKASLVFFPLAIFILHELLFERKELLKRYKEYLKLFFIAALLPAIWLLMGSMRIGSNFAEYYLFRSDQGVASVGLSKVNIDYVLYTYYSLQRRFFFVFVAGALFAIRYIKASKVFLMLLLGVGLIFQLSFTERSNNWYLIPSMPFWSLLVAFGTFHVLKLLKNNRIAIFAVVAVTAFLAYRTFTINILPILDSASNQKQMQSSKQINALATPTELVVRLDHLYPAAVYYTDRTIFASPDGTDGSRGYWLTRADVINNIRTKQMKWVYGKTGDIEAFQKTVPDIRFKVIKVNDEETILQAL